MTAFIGQEAMHRREHEDYNDALFAQSPIAPKFEAFVLDIFGLELLLSFLLFFSNIIKLLFFRFCFSADFWFMLFANVSGLCVRAGFRSTKVDIITNV